MSEEILEGMVSEPIPTDAEEQVQPNVEETTEEAPAISMSELMFNKLLEIQDQREGAISVEDRKRGVRLLRSPYDSLWFESPEALEEEVRRIREKTSTLSRSQRDALMQLQMYVIYELSNAQNANNSTAEDSEEPETTEEKPAAETVAE